MCEDTLLTPVCVGGLLDFCIRCLWVDDAILATNGFAVPPGVVGLFALEVLKLLLEGALQRFDLSALGPVIGIARRVPLQEFDLILDLRVPDLSLGHNALELGSRPVVWRRQHALVDIGDGCDVGSELANSRLGPADAFEEVGLAQRL